MNMLKKCICLLLCLALLPGLTACGEKDAAVGDYIGVSVTGDGAALALVNIYPAGLKISLRSGGRAVLTSGENEMSGTWARTDGASLSFTFDGAAYDGALHNDMLSLVDPEHENLTFLLRRDDGTGETVPLTAQTLEEAIGDSLGTADFRSPTKKLYVGMELYGSMRFSQVVKADGTKDEGEMYVDVWGNIDKDAAGNTFLEVFTAEEHEGMNPVLSLYIKLAPNLIAPVIGKDNAWLGSMYLTPEEAKFFAVRLKNGALNFTMPYKDPSGYACVIDMILREKDTPWDLHGDRFAPTGVTMEDVAAALDAE